MSNIFKFTFIMGLGWAVSATYGLPYLGIFFAINTILGVIALLITAFAD